MNSQTHPANQNRKKQECRQWIDQVLTQLAQRLEQGYSEEMQQYIQAMAHFPMYSIHNLFLILAQRPQATRVAGFQTWSRFKRSVRRGEKGIRILAPVIRRRSEPVTHPDSETEKEAQEDPTEERSLTGFRPVYVFDVAQTAGEELPQPSRAQGDAKPLLALMEQAIRAQGIRLEYGDTGAAYGLSGKGWIRIRSGMESAETFSTLAHEFAHELLHHPDRMEKTDRFMEELEADAAACVVSEHFGLQSLKACSDYIRMWEGNKQKLLERLERIRKCASTIIQSIETQKDSSMSNPNSGLLPSESTNSNSRKEH